MITPQSAPSPENVPTESRGTACPDTGSPTSGAPGSTTGPTSAPVADDERLDRSRKLKVRRRVLVDRQLQIGLAARASMFTFCVIALISAALFLPLIHDLGRNGGQHVDVDNAIVLLYLHERFWPLAFGAVLLSALLSILTSHRVAGPLVRVKRILWSIAEGRIPGPLETRDRDFLKEEVRALNAATSGLRDTRRHLDAACHDLRSSVAEAERSIGRTNDSRTQTALRRIESQLAILERHLGRPTPDADEKPEPVRVERLVESTP